MGGRQIKCLINPNNEMTVRIDVKMYSNDFKI